PLSTVDSTTPWPTPGADSCITTFAGPASRLSPITLPGSPTVIRTPPSSLVLGEHLTGHCECRVRRGNTDVDRGLQQHLDDLVAGEAVAERRANVEPQLVEVSARHQCGEHSDGAVPVTQAGSGPDATPDAGGDVVLEVAGYFGGVGAGAVHVLAAEHLPAHGHPRVVIGLSHRVLARCSSTAVLQVSAWATLAMCAASSMTTMSAPGMPSRSTRPTDGGLTASSAPKITRVGTTIRSSWSVTSNVASASQQAA